MEIRPKADSSLGWAYRPDSDTVAALSRGRTKVKDQNLGSDRPHLGGSGNLAEALEEARKADLKRRGIGKKRKGRRRRMARKVNLKELAARKGSKKKTVASKKKTVHASSESTGKLIPLKKLCEKLDLDPKATRVKLRRLIAKGDIEFHDHAARWEFTPAQAKQIEQALS